MWMPILLACAALQGVPETDRGSAAAPSPEARPAADVLIGKGLGLYRRRRFREARAAFREAVEANPSAAAAHYYLAYTLYKIGEPTRRMVAEKVEAKEEFARCFELDPTFRPAWAPR
jgi:tetratricopeptide (TPR) repeat protein